MFSTNPDNMRMEPTPERVLSICRLLACQSMTKAEMRKALTLGQNNEKGFDQINKSIKVALEELELLKSQNDKLMLAIDPEILATSTTFRRHVSSIVFQKKETTFVMFTRWFIAQNERVFALRSWEGMAKTCSKEVGELSELKENSALGWRFWAAFLGIGYMSGTMMIPNMKLRLQDLFVTEFPKRFPYDEAVRATDYIQWLSGKMPEADLTGKLPLAPSAGLRTLHELGLIKMETWQDSNRVKLYNVEGDPINEFSHITVKELIAK